MQVSALFIGMEKADYLNSQHHSQPKSPNKPSPITIYFQEKLFINNVQIILKLWNPTGQEQYHKIRQLSFFDMDAVIIAFFINQADLNQLKSYYEQLRSKSSSKFTKLYLLPKKYQNKNQPSQALKNLSIPSSSDRRVQIILEENELLERIGRNYIQQQQNLKIRQSKCCTIS